MSKKKRVLFVCTGASCRSQLAAGWARHLAGGRLESFAAGTDPQGLNPRAVGIMAEIGIDISASASASVYDFLGQNLPDIVIAVCSDAGHNCPDFPATVPTLHWSFDDPASAAGEEAEVEAVFRRVRDEIRDAVSSWICREFALEPFSALALGSERTA
jgi:arsenate reductase